jgi:hypothetical protein
MNLVVTAIFRGTNPSLITNVIFTACNTKLALGVPRRSLSRKLATIMKLFNWTSSSVAPDTELFLDESLSRIPQDELGGNPQPTDFAACEVARADGF